VNYRDLVADSAAAVGTVLEELGLDRTAAPPPVLRPQADERSNTWVERFLVDAADQGITL
jgi:LPS sulfotransferase NodH